MIELLIGKAGRLQEKMQVRTKVQTYYTAFGLTMAALSSKSAGVTPNKKQFNGIEHTEDLDLNQYDAFYRTLDPQLGRWWQIDPKIESALFISPYAIMSINPVLLTDPLGDIVGYTREESVSRREFRQFKRDIRMMRHNSESFRATFNEFKKDSRVFNYVAVKDNKGGVTNPTEKGFDMRIGVHSIYPEQGNEKNSTIQTIAHEQGHAWLKMHNMIEPKPQLQLSNPMNKDQIMQVK